MNQLSHPFRMAKVLVTLALALTGTSLFAQITTSAISGVVSDKSGEPLVGATVVATHNPSGTRYGTATNGSGHYILPAIRVGGPYSIAVSYTGYETDTKTNLYTTLGNTLSGVDFQLRETGMVLEEVSVVANRSDIFGSNRTGAATNINDEMMATLPTLGRSLNDFLRLTPQSRSSSVASTTGSGVSFAGQDSRFNNLTIDGSIFNNSFGLASAPAGQTNSTPISLDAIEEIQVSIAPYDVRQGGFTGAGINAVTRSGTNRFEGSIFANYRTESWAGDSVHVGSERQLDGQIVKTDPRNVAVSKQDFFVKQFGFRFGGPLIKNKLFFFINGEIERREDPATQYVAFRDEQSTPSTDPNVTRVKASDLDQLRDFLIKNFQYDPGRYEKYPLETYSDKFLAKVDYNYNDKNRASFRFNYLKSYRDVLTSQSGSFQNRVLNKFALNFEASNYIINNNIYSGIFELNSQITNSIANNLQLGFTANRDFRGSRGGVFPLVDILEGGRNYTTFGYEPFTPNNILNTDTWQFKDDVTYFKGKHTFTAGVNFESFKFDNTFTPTYYGQYAYKSLADFYADASNPGQDSVKLERYSLTYSALPGAKLPTATTKAYMPGVYLQDVISLVKDRLKVTVGMRVDVPFFGKTALHNSALDTLVFQDENGRDAKYSTSQLPKTNFLLSPRVGFNWDLTGEKKIQVRGGTGLFSGRPAFVWISNQLGNNGLLTGSFSAPNTYDYPFSADVTTYIPDNNTAPSSYNLSLTDDDFKFPQLWRSNIGVDIKLPWDIAATVEYMYNKNIHEVKYINANLESPAGNFEGADNRPYFPGLGLSSTAQNNANRVVDFISDATVLKNGAIGKSQSFTLKLERQFNKNFFVMAAYNFAEAKDLITAGSIAFSSWRDNRSVYGNNLPDLAFSDFDQRHRIIAALSYRLEYFKFGATTVSLFSQSGNQGRTSVTYNGDYNGDQLSANDLIYIPNSASELTFKSLQSIADYNGDGVKDTVKVSAAQQAAAFDNFLNGDEYLSKNKGTYAKRNGFLLPWLSTVDLGIQQEFFIKLKNRNHRLQFRADIYNFGNLINKSWGVGDVPTNNAALKPEGKTTGPNGGTVQQLSFGTVNSSGKYEAPSKILNKGASLSDVWQLQLGIRYTFD